MKRIFFYTNMKIYDDTFGITKKVKSQINAFKDLGFDVFYSSYTKKGVAIYNADNNIIYKRKFKTNFSLINRILRRKILIKTCHDFLNTTNYNYDLSYFRYHFFDFKYLNLLKVASEKSKNVVIESHSKPSFERRLSPMIFVYIQDFFWSKFAYKYVDLIAAMYNTNKVWGINAIEIENGVDFNEIKPHNPRRTNDCEIHLISVAYESRVHGIDRVIKGIIDYDKNPEKWKFVVHMVGVYLPETMQLTKKIKKSEIIFYGPLSGEKLDEVFDKADIAIGSLGNHRNNSYYGSALKTKEYLAKGIPFIYGWKERILEDNNPFIKRFELCEEPIDMLEVINLYEFVLNNRNIGIMNYITEDITWIKQMKEIVDTIEI